MQTDWTLEALTAFMKANHLSKVKMGGLEVELSPSAFKLPDTDVEALAKAEKMAPNEDELLRWSAPGGFVEPEDVVKPNA